MTVDTEEDEGAEHLPKLFITVESLMRQRCWKTTFTGHSPWDRRRRLA